MRRRCMYINSNVLSLRTTAAGLVAVCALVFAAGCGSDTSSSSPSSPCRTVGRAADGRMAAGVCPFDTDVAVDITAFPRTEEAVGAVADHVIRSADGTITHGGHLRVTAFGRVAARQLVVYDGDVPTLKEQDEVDRGPTEDGLRAAIRSTTRTVLNGAPSDRSLARQIANLTKGGGTDVARAVRDAARGRDDRPRAVVILTDGWHDQPGFRLATVVDGHGSTNDAVKRLVTLAGDRVTGVDVLELSGLGYAPARYAGNETPARTDRLTAVWDHVCRALRPHACSMNNDI